MLANFGQNPPSLVEFGQIRTHGGPNPAESVKCGRRLCSGSRCSTTIGQPFSNFGATSEQLRSNFGGSSELTVIAVGHCRKRMASNISATSRRLQVTAYSLPQSASPRPPASQVRVCAMLLHSRLLLRSGFRCVATTRCIRIFGNVLIPIAHKVLARKHTCLGFLSSSVLGATGLRTTTARRSRLWRVLRRRKAECTVHMSGILAFLLSDEIHSWNEKFRTRGSRHQRVLAGFGDLNTVR